MFKSRVGPESPSSLPHSLPHPTLGLGSCRCRHMRKARHLEGAASPSASSGAPPPGLLLTTAHPQGTLTHTHHLVSLTHSKNLLGLCPCFLCCCHPYHPQPDGKSPSKTNTFFQAQDHSRVLEEAPLTENSGKD